MVGERDGLRVGILLGLGLGLGQPKPNVLTAWSCPSHIPNIYGGKECRRFLHACCYGGDVIGEKMIVIEMKLCCRIITFMMSTG
jgi:hypothetical protein